VTTFDLNILPIHRNNGQDLPDLPGLLAVTAPRKTARGREKDNLIIYLMLSGNATFSTAELNQLNTNTANLFYQTAGSLTSAMRKASENINSVLLERNLATTGRGQYALGIVVLAVIRESQCTLLLSGPTHAVWVTEGQSRHIYDAALSGKGLGSGQSIQTYLSQVELHTNDLLVLCGKFPKDWEADLLGERPPASLEASYRKLTFTKGDLNAALIQPQVGSGVITVLRAQITLPRPSQDQPAALPQTVAAESISPPVVEAPDTIDPHELEDVFSISTENQNAETDQPQIKNHPSDTSEIIDSTNPESHPTITEEELDQLADFAAHMLQPSGYAIPPQPEDLLPPFPAIETPTPATTNTISTPRNFPPSIPRINPVETKIEPAVVNEEPEEETGSETEEAVSVTSALDAKLQKPDAHVIATRQMAKVMVGAHFYSALFHVCCPAQKAPKVKIRNSNRCSSCQSMQWSLLPS